MFDWWERYRLRHEGYETIAGDPTRQAAVRIAVSRLAHALDRPLRKGRPWASSDTPDLTLNSFGHFAIRLFVYLRLSVLLEYIHACHATGTHRPPRGVAQRRDAGTSAGRSDTMTPAKRPSTRARQTPIQSLDDLTVWVEGAWAR